MSGDAGHLSPDVIVVSQLSSEPPSAFAARVVGRIARLESSRAVERAVMVCGSRSDDASFLARANTARALLAAMQRSPSAKLTLAGPPVASDRQRHQMFAIAGTLVEQSRTKGLEIEVHLGEPLRGGRKVAAARPVVQGPDTPRKVA